MGYLLPCDRKEEGNVFKDRYINLLVKNQYTHVRLLSFSQGNMRQEKSVVRRKSERVLPDRKMYEIFLSGVGK